MKKNTKETIIEILVFVLLVCGIQLTPWYISSFFVGFVTYGFVSMTHNLIKLSK